MSQSEVFTKDTHFKKHFVIDADICLFPLSNEVSYKELQFHLSTHSAHKTQP